MKHQLKSSNDPLGFSDFTMRIWRALGSKTEENSKDWTYYWELKTKMHIELWTMETFSHIILKHTFLPSFAQKIQIFWVSSAGEDSKVHLFASVFLGTHVLFVTYILFISSTLVCNCSVLMRTPHKRIWRWLFLFWSERSACAALGC